jgi:hypothetical protein
LHHALSCYRLPNAWGVRFETAGYRCGFGLWWVDAFGLFAPAPQDAGTATRDANVETLDGEVADTGDDAVESDGSAADGDAAKVEPVNNRFKTSENPCLRRGTAGFYCARTIDIEPYTGIDFDNHLVECDVKKTKSVTVCARGCVSMGSGIPDLCDDCPASSTRAYCTSEFAESYFTIPSGQAVVNCVSGTLVGNAGTKCVAPNPNCNANPLGSKCGK